MIVGPFCRGYTSHLSESNNYACQTSDSIPPQFLCQYTGIGPYTYQQFQYSVGLVGLAKYVTSGRPPKLILNLKVLSKASLGKGWFLRLASKQRASHRPCPFRCRLCRLTEHLSICQLRVSFFLKGKPQKLNEKP